MRMLNAHFEAAGDLIGSHGLIAASDLGRHPVGRRLTPSSLFSVDHFVSADQRLCDIATLVGLAVINPEQP